MCIFLLIHNKSLHHLEIVKDLGLSFTDSLYGVHVKVRVLVEVKTVPIVLHVRDDGGLQLPGEK